MPAGGTARERLLSDYFADYVGSGRSGRAFALRAPRAALVVLATALTLPRLKASLDGSAEAGAVRDALTHKRGPGRLPVHELSSVLRLPARRGDYASGSERQTLRRQVRRAEREGVTWNLVDGRDRIPLLACAVQRERHHPRAEYRTSGAGTDRLLDHRLWLVALDRAGDPILLSVTPVDGEWAALTYFRTLVDSPAASAARYLMTQVLVDELVDRGVCYLADSSSPIGLSNGLRHFQRMLGFRIHRITVVRRSD